MQVHRYAAAKGSPERLDLSRWHFTRTTHPHSPAVAEGRVKGERDDTCQPHS